MHNLALVYLKVNRLQEALNLNEETLALEKVRLGPDHPDTLQTMNNLGITYEALGRRADAVKLEVEAVKLMTVKLGPDHRITLESMHNLANNYEALGRHAEALKLREQTLSLRKAKLGPDHPDTLMSMGDVARSLFAVDRGAEAVALIDECVRLSAGKDVNPALLPAVITLRLRHFEQINDAVGCRQTAVMWEKLKRSEPDGLYKSACFRAVAAAVLNAADKSASAGNQTAAEANRAMAWLKQSIAAGYKDAAHMKTDNDLGFLRAREDFKKLVLELERVPHTAKAQL